MSEAVDHQARHDAALALEKIEAHTKSCEDAQARQEKALDRMTGAVERLHGRIDRLLWGVLSALAVVVLQVVLTKIGLI